MERCYNVLIADSNEAFCEELAQRLSGEEGFIVAGTATDGVRALELMRRCDRIIDAGVTIGETNARMAELVAAARAMPGYESRA